MLKAKRSLSILLAVAMVLGGVVSAAVDEGSIPASLPEGAYRVQGGIYAVDNSEIPEATAIYQDVNIGTVYPLGQITQPPALDSIVVEPGHRWLCIRVQNAPIRINFAQEHDLVFGADYYEWPVIGTSPQTTYYIDTNSNYYNFIKGAAYQLQCTAADSNTYNDVTITIGSVAAQAVSTGIVPIEDRPEVSEYFYYSEEHEEVWMQVCNIQQNPESGEITFNKASDLEGLPPKYPDLVYVIDDDTAILETQETLDQFLAGELPWLIVALSKEDVQKVADEGLRTIHAAAVSWMSADIAIYPSPRLTRLKEYGIMVGDADGEFHPYRSLTRAELAKIAVMMYNPDFMADADLSAQSFSDVGPDHWAYPYIEYAQQSGIIDGYDDGTFRPEAEVTIEEALKMVVSLLGYAPMAEDTGGYPDGYLNVAEKLELSSGISVKQTEPIVRAEMADVAGQALYVPLMVPAEDGTYVICDGSLPDFPRMTLSIKNFEE